jgi:two-component system, NtrC family, sensor kinase
VGKVESPIAFRRLGRGLMRSFWERVKPPGPDTPSGKSGSPLRHLFNYRRIWKLAVLLTGGVSLIPLIFITLVDYQVTQRAIESELDLRTIRIVSNTRQAISFFLSERIAALQYIIRDNTFELLNDPGRLQTILENLNKSFSEGFVDLGVIDPLGSQRNYVGPYELRGKDYSEQEWYKQVVMHGVHVSDVFLGYRQIPHFVLAVKRDLSNGSFFVLRAAIGIAPFERLLSELELEGKGDAFMINHEGTLQTSSRYHGRVLERLPLPVPPYSSKTEVVNMNGLGHDLVIGYRLIDETPFILMIVKQKHELMKPWFGTRVKLIAFLLFSVSLILAVILGMATYMVRKMQLADERRVMTLHEVEYANKLASIGRLAASVAHEINNPLAIINEKAGLIKDLFTIKRVYTEDRKLFDLVEGILQSVKRAASITRGLLSFARNIESSVEPIDLKEMLREVLSFLGKEAEHRGVKIVLDIDPDVPVFQSDRGKLQQISLNIINNSFAAVSDGGQIEIHAVGNGKDTLSISFSDNGCGIPREDLHRVFEPFFSSRSRKGGTGLGLSITYNLVQELGGEIKVESEPGMGTRFTVSLPLAPKGAA